MRLSCAVLSLLLLMPAAIRADDAAEARAIIDRGIQALGGAEAIEKYQAMTVKMKGELNTPMGQFAFTGEVITQGRDQQRVEVDVDFGGQTVKVVQVLNRDKGWAKFADQVMELDEDRLAEAQEESYASWITTLVPLKDKAFKLAIAGEVKVGDRPAVGVRVSHEGRRDVTLFFDKESYLLVKTEGRAKDEETGQEVSEETILSDYKGDPLKVAWKVRVKRDGKPYLDGDLTDVKLDEKLDDKVFGEP